MRVAILSDIHANLTALEAVLAAIGPVDAIWHLGDVVGYGPDPDAVVERLEALGALGVKGNHDAAATGGDEADFFNPDAKAAISKAFQDAPTKAKAAFDKLSDGKDREFKQVDAKYYEPVVELIKFIDSLRKQKS